MPVLLMTTVPLAAAGGIRLATEPLRPVIGGGPEWWYLAAIVASEMKPTKAGTGSYLELTFQVLEGLLVAVEHGLRLPIVYNTSAYDAMESLHLLDGVVDIYMPDFKMWDERLSLRYLKAKDYPQAARQAFKEMHRQVGVLKMDENGLAKRGVLVRHLVMPDDIAGTEEIMRFLAEELSPDTYVNIMDQYRPAGKVNRGKDGEINRRTTSREVQQAQKAAEKARLWRFDQRQPRWFFIR